MLRTNNSFLSFIEQAFANQESDKGIVLKKFQKGSLMLQQGNKAVSVFVVKSGITKCFFSEENGKNYILEFLGEGEIVGEIELMKNMPCLCNIEALTEVWAYVISISHFKLLVERNITFNQLLLDELAERIINTSSRSSFQQLYTKKHALHKILALQREKDIIITKDDMADYLGITLRSLNRLLKA